MTRFTLNPDSVPAVILAGGRSSRMGSNKGLVRLGGKAVLEHIVARMKGQANAFALNADPDWPNGLGLRLVPDTIQGKAGPLAGILAAMRDTAAAYPDATHIATVPVDSPFFPRNLLARLAEAVEGPDEIAIAASGSHDHPVFGLWPVSIAGDLEAWLSDAGHRRVHDFLLRHAVTEVDFPMIETRNGPLDPFFNINTPDDLAAAEKWLEELDP